MRTRAEGRTWQIEPVWGAAKFSPETEHTTLGPFGPPTSNPKMPGGQCPGCRDGYIALHGATNSSSCCDITFTLNWLHAAHAVWPPSKRAGGTTPAESSWFKIQHDNTVIPANEALPADAAAIVVAAGPRSHPYHSRL